MAESKLSSNPLSIAGAALTTLSAVLFLLFVLLEAFGLLHGPYAGLIGYVLLPLIFLVGLALIPLGMWREGRRRRRGVAAWSWPPIDLGQRRTRRVIMAIAVLTTVNLAIVALAAVGVVHYTESNQFCGQVCHTPMTPQFTAHAVYPHSRVECVSCHVSPGAKGLISAKLNGTRQMYLAMTGGFSRPIAEARDRVPGATDTCVHCHTPGCPQRDLVRNLVSYGDDEANTESVTTLTMHAATIHWHARPDIRVEYIAAEAKRETIPYIKVTDARGTVTEYFAEGVSAPPAGTLHQMDCLDCHNRPAHSFSPTADRAVDALLASDSAIRGLPFARREILAAVKAEYPNQDDAAKAIASHLRESFKSVGPQRTSDVTHAVDSAQQLYRHNVFPEMKVTWGTYMSQLGHTDVPGCFRCHDEAHKSRAGAAIRQDCELCHKMQ